MENKKKKGSFTLPGEAGYEKLSLELAEKWGADAIRDCDGTQLSQEILSSGYDIYSTICIIRQDNEWAKKHPELVQQNFLMSVPVTARGETVPIHPLDGYFTSQFKLNLKDSPREFWQVFDRTANREVPPSDWDCDPETGLVTVRGCTPYHRYTVNFLVYRVWEVISMYNQITNHLNKDHLMPLEPRYPQVQRHMLEWLENWCVTHPATTVARFTSMFYNFTWIWGSDSRNRNLYTDWGSYDFSVNSAALREFEKKYGYRMTSEDFINKGKHNNTHNNPTRKYRDWMNFTNEFVTAFGKKLVDIVHKHGKKAFVFYDDSWIGVEPYSDRFADIGFDGIIKCVFSAFEVRKCAGVKGAKTKELRLHPYLFPTGLSGEPTFLPGGNPALDAKRFWINVRRALLRAPVDRIGLGGYLHLVKDFPDFCDTMEKLADEFRLIKALHNGGAPYSVKPKVAVLTSWGKLRSWITSGSMHEHPDIDLTNILEALAGLPVEVEFISFDDIRAKGIPENVSVIINAGTLDSAWSGGGNWDDPEIAEKVSKFVAEGGGLIAVNEATARRDGDTYFALSNVLGIDRDTGDRNCSGKYEYACTDHHFILECEPALVTKSGIFVLNGDTVVLKEQDKTPVAAAHRFGKGRSVYLSSFKYGGENTRDLFNAILWVSGCESEKETYVTDNYRTECAYYPNSGTLAIINNSSESQNVSVKLGGGKTVHAVVNPFDIDLSAQAEK